MPSPFINWVGGKRQLLPQLRSNLPSQYNRYFEPFIGGGALFFALEREDSFISDDNKELINLYEVIRDNPVELFDSIFHHENTYEYYYHIRSLDRKPDYHLVNNIAKASRFLFLNKTGFNGLYRVNKSGYNNVPFGSRKNPKIADKQNLIDCSKLLQKTNISACCFESIKDNIMKGDFIYFDPPYIPVSKSSSFTSYTSSGFDMIMHRSLKNLCDYVNSVGAYFMLSNSSASIIRDMYSEYNIQTVSANRVLNCKKELRGKVLEFLITNY